MSVLRDLSINLTLSHKAHILLVGPTEENLLNFED